MRRGVALIVVSLLLAGFASPAVAGAVAAAVVGDELAVSRDGRVWSDHLPGSLFDPAVRWVPGDRRAESFFVRNRADGAGDLRIAVRSTDPDRLLRNEDVRIDVRIAEGAWQWLDPDDRAVTLDAERLPAGEQRRVTVRAGFDTASGNRSQRDGLALDFVVTLSDADAGDGGDNDDGADDGGGGLLPDTGARVGGWMIVVAAVAVGTGLALMRRGARERKGAPHGSVH